MSSSGKGQSTVKSESDIQVAWDYAQSGGRAGEGRVIVEGFVDFDYEITLLTVRHRDGTTYCAPIGHRQENGDYQESWQPQPMSDAALSASQQVAGAITEALGGMGIFGVELFIKGDQVYFSEVSPRHDTGLVTLLSESVGFACTPAPFLACPSPISTNAALLPPPCCWYVRILNRCVTADLKKPGATRHRSATVQQTRGPWQSPFRGGRGTRRRYRTGP